MKLKGIVNVDGTVISFSVGGTTRNVQDKKNLIAHSFVITRRVYNKNKYFDC